MGINGNRVYIVNDNDKEYVGLLKAVTLVSKRKKSLGESSDKFSVGQHVKYSKKDWTISSQTKDWIELEDNRGLTTIIDKDEISSFKNGVLMTENDIRITEEEINRMNNCL